MNLLPLRNQHSTQSVAQFSEWFPRFFREQLGLHLSMAPESQFLKEFDLAFQLDENQAVRHLVVEVKPRWLQKVITETAASFDKVGTKCDVVPLLAIPKLSDRARNLLRAASINHVDLSGTLYIRAPGLYIDLRSNAGALSGSFGEVNQEGQVTSVNPFSDTASVVLRLLLEQPQRSWGIQELADSGEISAAWVTNVAKVLEEREYATRSQSGSGRESDLRLNDPVTALQDWADAYSWQANRMTSYNVPMEYEEILQRIPDLQYVLPQKESEATHALTLLGAADFYATHVRHEQIHLYVNPRVGALMDAHIRGAWHGESIARGGNVHVIQPYYKRSVFVGARTIDSIPVVSPVQLYLDLVNYPLRGKEAAGMLVRTVLEPLWGLSSDQMRGLLL